LKEKIVVCKFGGSATTSEQSIENIRLLTQDKTRRILVFSAIGKEFQNDFKITDLLIALTKENDKVLIINKIKDKFDKISLKIDKNVNINEKINKTIAKYNKNKDFNYLISRGEYLTSYLLSKYLNIPFVPAEKIVYFKNEKIDYRKIRRKLSYYLNKYQQIIVPGFYGIDENNKLKLFSRGGSDVTGAIFAKILKSCIYENWTDVDGVKEINPIFSHSNTIRKMNYSQLKLMTSMDAKVIHKDCADILKGKGIGLLVANIFNINGEKTTVDDFAEKSFFVCYKENKKGVLIVSSNNRMFVRKEELKEKILKIYEKGE